MNLSLEIVKQHKKTLCLNLTKPNVENYLKKKNDINKCLQLHV
jgi:hypothetical protein